jgi:glycosyltransferase involved in cell wall biosynthesis
VKGQVRDAERSLRSYFRVAIIRAVSKARTDAARWCAGRSNKYWLIPGVFPKSKGHRSERPSRQSSLSNVCPLLFCVFVSVTVAIFHRFAPGADVMWYTLNFHRRRHAGRGIALQARRICHLSPFNLLACRYHLKEICLRRLVAILPVPLCLCFLSFLFISLIEKNETYSIGSMAAEYSRSFSRPYRASRNASTLWHLRTGTSDLWDGFLWTGRHRDSGGDLGTLRFIVVGARIPLFDSRGSDVRMLDILRALRHLKVHVTYVAHHSSSEVTPFHCRAIRRLGVSVFPFSSMKRVTLRTRYDAILYHLWYWHFPELTSFRSSLNWVRMNQPSSSIIVMSDDIHFVRYKYLLNSKREELNSSQIVHLERKIAAIRQDECNTYREADIIASVTKTDARMIEDVATVPRSKIVYLPYVAEDPGPLVSREFGQCSGLAFVGGPNTLNLVAIVWFAEKVWPTVRRLIPDNVSVHVIGNVCTLIRNSHHAHLLNEFVLHDHVRDIDTLLSSLRVSIAPIVGGTGINTKNVLAMRNGVPLVTTPAGAEGLQLDTSAADVGTGVLVADSAESFAVTVASVYNNKTLWKILHQSGPRHVLSHLSYDRLVKKVDTVLSAVRARALHGKTQL